MEVVAYSLGAAALVFALTALSQVKKLEKQLKEAGVLK